MTFRLVRALMHSALSPFVCVRVRRLLRDPQSYDGWRVNQRAPQVGDLGTVLDVLSAPNLPDTYVVENCLPDGSCIWLADFADDEIEVDQPSEV